MNPEKFSAKHVLWSRLLKSVLLWVALLAVITLPAVIAASSPLLAWRDPVYSASGFAGVLAMTLLLVQPLLVGGYLPGVRKLRGRITHRWMGAALLGAVVIHVGGLWITSPPDVVDALLLRSPTPFSLWGVIAMWTTVAAALLAVFRRRLRITMRTWRCVHALLVMSTVAASTAHALLIEGTMGTVSKVLLCALAISATCWAVIDLRSLSGITRWWRR